MRGRFFAFLYVDIGNLRAVNHRYGVARGDHLIRKVANILSEIIVTDEEFLGYMGEDDFVVLTVPVRVDQIFSGMVAKFDEEMSQICPELAARHSDRDLEVKLDVAVVTNETRQFGDPLQVKNLALEVLKKARSEKGHWCSHLKDSGI